jgi:NAD(P)-dependent dehydrogenase (short-subunit alcohol dehydrogenase family)
MHPVDKFRLDGRVALVTGASSGFGAHFARTLAQSGARVVLAARRLDRLEALVAELPNRAFAVAMDVTDPSSVTAAFDQLATAGIVPDILVNNAGISIYKPALEQTVDDWDAVVDTNLRGAWLVATEAARRLVAVKKPGCIVNIASLLSVRVGGGVAPYAASKAGLSHLTEALALEWARYGIRVNSIAPGYFATDLNHDFLASDAGEKMRLRIPQRRFGRPEDLDGPLLLLASEAGGFMTGTLVVADGGHRISTV